MDTAPIHFHRLPFSVRRHGLIHVIKTQSLKQSAVLWLRKVNYIRDFQIIPLLIFALFSTSLPVSLTLWSKAGYANSIFRHFPSPLTDSHMGKTSCYFGTNTVLRTVTNSSLAQKRTPRRNLPCTCEKLFPSTNCKIYRFPR